MFGCNSIARSLWLAASVCSKVRLRDSNARSSSRTRPGSPSPSVMKLRQRLIAALTKLGAQKGPLIGGVKIPFECPVLGIAALLLEYLVEFLPELFLFNNIAARVSGLYGPDCPKGRCEVI